MIEHGNSHQLTARHQSRSEIAIVFTGLATTGRVIVRDDKTGGIGLECRL